jgi:hypothetical protein
MAKTKRTPPGAASGGGAEIVANQEYIVPHPLPAVYQQHSLLSTSSTACCLPAAQEDK